MTLHAAQCRFDINVINLIKNCHFQYRNIVAKFKNQYYHIIENPVLKIFSVFAEFYMIISTKTAPKPYIETPISKISHC